MQEMQDEFDDIDEAISQVNLAAFEVNKINDEKFDDTDEMDQLMSQIDVENLEGVIQNEIENGDQMVEIEIDPETGLPFEMVADYQEAVNELLPNKSGDRYVQAYEVFLKWQESHRTTSFDEKVMMVYFLEASKKYKPNTLFSMYSMLKKTFAMKQNVDLSRYTQLIAFLKRKNVGYKPNKANTFSAAEIRRFLLEAPDVAFLGMKAVAIFAVFGANRGIELTTLTVDNIKDDGREIVVRIPDSKNYSPILYQIDDEMAIIVRKYLKLRPANASSTRLFMQYRNGKCVNQVMGKNSIAQIPKQIATFLGLPNPDSYKGHSFRRSSTTILADTGAPIEMVKRHGNWKSNSVCEGYIQESLAHKRKTGHLISDAINLPGTSSTSRNKIQRTSTISSMNIRSSTSQSQVVSTSNNESTSIVATSNNESRSMVASMSLSQTIESTSIVATSNNESRSMVASTSSSDASMSLSQTIKSLGGKDNPVLYFGGSNNSITIHVNPKQGEKNPQ